MDKSRVMVEFSIYGEEFEPLVISNILGLVADETYIKGDPIRSGKMKRKETSWSISTGYVNSDDVNIQLKQIMSLLENKLEALLKIKKILTVNMLFDIVIYIKNKEVPAIRFEKHFIHFLSKIDAEVDFDTYVI